MGGGYGCYDGGRTIAADLCSAVGPKASRQMMGCVNLDMPRTQPLLQAAALICTFLKVTLVSGMKADF